MKKATSSTFSHTELLISDEERQEEDFKLPSSINVISIREALISDAPFISRANSGTYDFTNSSGTYIMLMMVVKYCPLRYRFI